MNLSSRYRHSLLSGLLLLLHAAALPAADLDELHQRAEQGNAMAQTELGYRYHVGEGVERDYTEAVNWYRRAAEQGQPDAQYNLGVAYAFGQGVERDLAQATNWYQRAADQGQPVAAFSLGLAYRYGDAGVRQDAVRAAELFQQAAQSGYTRAQVHLASLYHTGEGIPQNYEQAAYWYRQAAERGDATAQYNLANLHRSGRGVSQDEAEARRWYQAAADQGYGLAQKELKRGPQTPAAAGATSGSNDNGSVEQANNNQVKETRPASGRIVSPPLNPDQPQKIQIKQPSQKIGEPIRQVTATSENETAAKAAAAELDSSAEEDSQENELAEGDKADAGDEEKQVQAIATLDENVPTGQTSQPVVQKKRGFFSRLFDSPETETDRVAATAMDNDEWVEPLSEIIAIELETTDDTDDQQSTTDSASNADQPAHDELATTIAKANTALENGNYEQALAQLQKQALADNAAAETRLGDMYFQGLGINQSRDRALLWYRRAAKRGYADAQFNLGNMYLLGEGVLQDDHKAREWYAKAAEQGHQAAQNNLKNLERRMAEKRRYLPESHAGPTPIEFEQAVENSNTTESASATEESAGKPDETAAGNEAETPANSETRAPIKRPASGRIVSPPLEIND